MPKYIKNDKDINYYKRKKPHISPTPWFVSSCTTDLAQLFGSWGHKPRTRVYKRKKPHITVRLLKNKKATTYSPWGLTKYHQRGGA